MASQTREAVDPRGEGKSVYKWPHTRRSISGFCRALWPYYGNRVSHELIIAAIGTRLGRQCLDGSADWAAFARRACTCRWREHAIGLMKAKVGELLVGTCTAPSGDLHSYDHQCDRREGSPAVADYR